MLSQVIRFIRLPLLLLVLYTIARFCLGLAGVPYAPRGNAMFSIVGLTFVSSFYFGSMSGKVGGFGWMGTVLVGVCLGFFGEALIFLATYISYTAGLNTYFLHWDALNVAEGTVVPMARAMGIRAGGLIAGPITGTVLALFGRSLSFLAPRPAIH